MLLVVSNIIFMSSSSSAHDITLALELLHRAGWLHRDISTGNITVEETGARLIDFELAKRVPEDDDLSIVRILHHQ